MIRRAYHAVRIALAKRRLARLNAEIHHFAGQYVLTRIYYRREVALARAALTEAQADAAIAGCLHLDREWA